MTSRQKWFTSIALTFVAAAVIVNTYNRHAADRPIANRPQRAEVLAPAPSDDTIAKAIADAKVPVRSLQVGSAGGVVVLRGNGTADAAAKAGAIANSLGALRVANLITPAKSSDDENIRRAAERQLGYARGLTGCTLIVSCSNGVVHVKGTVQNELQKDAARDALRGLDGAREVQIELTKI